MRWSTRSDSLQSVSRRLFQLVAGIVLILATLTPLMECFDRWDKHPVPSSDTEIHLTAWFVGVGIVLSLAKLLRHVPVLVNTMRRSDQFLHAWPSLRQAESDPLETTGSPPPLIPLRI